MGLSGLMQGQSSYLKWTVSLKRIQTRLENKRKSNWSDTYHNLPEGPLVSMFIEIRDSQVTDSMQSWDKLNTVLLLGACNPIQNVSSLHV